MGFRFRKSVKIAPGVRLNFGKKSSSISFGGKGARYTVSSTGRKTASVGIPGTGISYTESFGKKKTSGHSSKGTDATMKKRTKMTTCKSCGSSMPVKSKRCPNCGKKVKKPIFKKWSFWIIILFFCSIPSMCADKDAPTNEVAESHGSISSVTESTEQKTSSRVPDKAEEQPKENEPVEVPVVIVETEDETQENAPTEETTEETTDKTEDTTEQTPEVVVPPVVEAPVVEAPVVETPVEEPTETPQPEEPIVETPVIDTPVVEEPVGTDYILNTSSKKFHETDCGSAKTIKDHNKEYFTGTRDELIAKGYDPCGNCHP